MFATLSNMAGSPWVIGILALAVVGLGVWRSMQGWAGASMTSFKSLIGPGTVLFSFLTIGIALALFFSYYGPAPGKVTQGLLVSYPDRDPSKGVVVEERDVSLYTHITVMTHITASKEPTAAVSVTPLGTAGPLTTETPKNAAPTGTATKSALATVIVYADTTSGGQQEVARLDISADTWSRTDWKNSAKHLTVTISTGGGGRLATQVDVLLFLSSE